MSGLFDMGPSMFYTRIDLPEKNTPLKLTNVIFLLTSIISKLLKINLAHFKKHSVTLKASQLSLQTQLKSLQILT